MYTTKALVFVVVAVCISLADSFIGYDCARTAPNITTFSLEHVDKCDYGAAQVNVSTIPIQLVQHTGLMPLKINVCRIKVNRQIKYCDWRKYASTIDETAYFHAITRDECADLITHGTIDYENHLLRELLPNMINYRSLTVAGTLEDDGDCYGSTYYTPGRTYSSVVVKVQLELFFGAQDAHISTKAKKVILPSGTRCDTAQNKCSEADGSHAFWEPIQDPACNYEEYVILFEGLGTKIVDESSVAPTMYFANSSKEVQFGLARTGKHNLCGYVLHATEDPSLFITEATPSSGPPCRRETKVEDVLLDSYFNTKIAYLARHVQTQFREMYKDVVLQRCRLERRVIENSLLHIREHPDLVAMIIMKAPGYVAIQAGEAAHLMPCEPITCQLRHVDHCY
uniref:Putative glycoprotein n=1 Tax=Soybean thrips chu-like virus 3 TaxID=2800865 RepID=A0A7T8JIE9_9VIRU|nr:putative glycoprotein [Soybean thrips chu-like virus 3]